MRVLVVGAGAVGGFFGAQLADAGVDVTFLARGDRARTLRDEGIRIIAPDGRATATAVRVRTAAELGETFDTVLVAVKGAGLSAALDDMVPALGPGTAVIPLLNGVAHLELMRGRLGERNLLGGVCLVATQLDGTGAIRQLAPMASIAVGELSGAHSARLESIAAAFSVAAFDTSTSTTIEQDMWEKWFFMATGGASTVLLGGQVGDIAAVDGGTDAVREIVAEAAAIMAAAGHSLRPDAYERVTSTPNRPRLRLLHVAVPRFPTRPRHGGRAHLG